MRRQPVIVCKSLDTLTGKAAPRQLVVLRRPDIEPPEFQAFIHDRCRMEHQSLVTDEVNPWVIAEGLHMALHEAAVILLRRRIIGRIDVVESLAVGEMLLVGIDHVHRVAEQHDHAAAVRQVFAHQFRMALRRDHRLLVDRRLGQQQAPNQPLRDVIGIRMDARDGGKRGVTDPLGRGWLAAPTVQDLQHVGLVRLQLTLNRLDPGQVAQSARERGAGALRLTGNEHGRALGWCDVVDLTHATSSIAR